MELQIKDRLYIPALLPKEGNFQQFNTKKSILRKIEISEEERSAVGLQENIETKRIEWDVEKDVPLTIDLNTEELAYLKEACEKLADQSLPDDMWATVERVFDACVAAG